MTDVEPTPEPTPEPEPLLDLNPSVMFDLEAENNQLRSQLRHAILERDTLKGQGNLRENFWQEIRDQITEHMQARNQAEIKANTFRLTLEDIAIRIRDKNVTLAEIQELANKALDRQPDRPTPPGPQEPSRNNPGLGRLVEERQSSE